MNDEDTNQITEQQKSQEEQVVEDEKAAELRDDPSPKIRPTVEPGDKNEPEAGG